LVPDETATVPFKRRPPRSLDLSGTSLAVEAVPSSKKTRREFFVEAATRRMSRSPFRFVRDPEELKAQFFPSSSSAAPAADKMKP
jgi:hypothetical protein